MPNRLAGASSPYLRQHAENPVDWYPWGSEALERARREDKPILLSVGYAACHWCHVMAHESFEDRETARVMNEHFVNVKVDREERPDVDGIYMQAVQAMTGQGGWPMTVFLTPDGAPFHGGTYFPPADRHGMPSFQRVLKAVSEAWRTRRAAIHETARQVRELLDAAASASSAAGPVDGALLDEAVRAFERSFDERHAGFGGAPKFPPSMALEFLLARGVRGGSRAGSMAERTFDAMARGGIFDQVGGGLHRYSVDDRWLVPHFEKMLYDNALFARLGVHVWQVNGEPAARRAVERTLDWVLREMRSPEGGFYSSLDADSAGGEGAFYVWDAAELDDLLGADAPLLREIWGVTAAGHFEGRNILSLSVPPGEVARRAGISGSDLDARMDEARVKLLSARERRPRPMTDDKVIAAWNGLMIGALAEAARVFDRPDYRGAALSAAQFLVDRMMRDGRLRRSYRDGAVSGQGFLDDQASGALSFLDLYALTFDAAWVGRAEALAHGIVTRHFEGASPLPFDTAREHEALLIRPREVADNAVPSGTSLTAELFLRLAELTADDALRERGERIVQALGGAMRQYPAAFGHLLATAESLVSGRVQVAIAGAPDRPDVRALGASLRRQYVPGLVMAGGTSDVEPVALMQGRTMRGGRATAYVCRGFVCDEPVSDAAALSDQLRRAVAVARG